MELTVYVFALWVTVIANSVTGGQCGAVLRNAEMYIKSSVIEDSGDCRGLSHGMKPHDL